MTTTPTILLSRYDYDRGDAFTRQVADLLTTNGVRVGLWFPAMGFAGPDNIRTAQAPIGLWWAADDSMDFPLVVAGEPAFRVLWPEVLSDMVAALNERGADAAAAAIAALIA
jgi:hypothetical protein